MTAGQGILPDHEISALVDAGSVTAFAPLSSGQIQPASLDLRLGGWFWQVKASFLPLAAETVRTIATELSVTRGTLDDNPIVFKRGCVYIVQLEEMLALDDVTIARANPKSSIGRIDVFARLLCDGHGEVDRVPAGYRGPLYLEVTPLSFDIAVRRGDRLAQLRFIRGDEDIILTRNIGVDLSNPTLVAYEALIDKDLTIDLADIGGHEWQRFWRPRQVSRGSLTLQPDAFYLLASTEPISIPNHCAAEMAAYDVPSGEFRAHYAGFFDPGFGLHKSARAVMEVRPRDVPFMIRHGQRIACLDYAAMASPPTKLYGQDSGASYQGQHLRLSKYFR